MLLALRRMPSFFDPAAQGARMQLEKACCAIGAVDLPARTLEDLDDMRAVDVLES